MYGIAMPWLLVEVFLVENTMYFICLIFMVFVDTNKILATKIPQLTVYYMYTLTVFKAFTDNDHFQIAFSLLPV